MCFDWGVGRERFKRDPPSWWLMMGAVEKLFCCHHWECWAFYPHFGSTMCFMKEKSQFSHVKIYLLSCFMFFYTKSSLSFLLNLKSSFWMKVTKDQKCRFHYTWAIFYELSNNERKYSIQVSKNICRFGIIVYFCIVIVIHVGIALLDNEPISIKPEDYY